MIFIAFSVVLAASALAAYSTAVPQTGCYGSIISVILSEAITYIFCVFHFNAILLGLSQWIGGKLPSIKKRSFNL
jgi:hypothetical protein